MTARRTLVGVLGGMGPDATVDFMAKVIAMTPAQGDQDHVHMIVDHNPAVPNRQAAILGDGEDPAPVLVEMAERLASAGADFLVIPCNTVISIMALRRPMWSEMLPQAMRPMPLRMAYQAMAVPATTPASATP